MNDFILTVVAGSQNRTKTFKWEFTGDAEQAIELLTELVKSANRWIYAHKNTLWMVESATIEVAERPDYGRLGNEQEQPKP